MEGDYWYQHTSQEVVSGMLSSGLQNLTGKTDDAAAWDALFKHFNDSRGHGAVGYYSGETIVIKTNNNARWKGEHGINTSPQITWAILDQLVNQAGVSEIDIFIGDPNCGTPDYTYDHCMSDFPDVNYWGQNADVAREDDVLVLSDLSLTDPLPRSYIDASYMINIPVFKKHHRAGISIAAKNHFGSIAPFTDGAWHLHYSLPCPEASGVAVNGNYGAYRCFVDLMGHKDLGGKTILYLVDGLWGSTNWGHPPVRWSMPPFNYDWPNSLFLSQDPVAVESVCLDFLYEEFDGNHPTEGGTPTEDKGPFPHFKGTDDYLRQAADPSLRPFDYDPEGDGSVLGSLGVHERWNNARDKQYSRNLGLNVGIELFSEQVASSIEERLVVGNGQISNHPNPFSRYTRIRYYQSEAGTVHLNIYNINGQKVYDASRTQTHAGNQEFIWNGTDARGKQLPGGQYVLNLTKEDGNENLILKMMIVR